LGEGAVRAADEPGTPTLADDAAKAAQLPEAMAEARVIKEANDVLNTPIPVLLAELMALKTRYRWIETFAATPVGPGVFHIELIASRNDLGDYTTGGIPGAPRAPDPAHVTLDRIADQYETLLTADPARHARFLEIEQLARTNPEQAARLAAELEEDLISHSRLLGGVDAPLDAPTGSMADLADPGTLGARPTPGRAQPRAMEAGNFTHANAEALRDVLPAPRIPAQFAADRAAGDLIPLSELPDGLLAEARLGVTSRVDRVTPTTIVDPVAGIIYEIKPDNARQIVNGLEQARGYANLANASMRGGRSDWRAVVVVYNQRAATRMIR
ncbi:hypothetical protein, partial [Micromonospora sp. I033]